MKLKYLAQLAVVAALSMGAMTSCDDDDAVLTQLDAPQATLVDKGYTTLSFKWDKVANATQYGYELCDASGEVVEGDVITANSVSFTGLTDDTSYTLNVWAYAAVHSTENEKSQIASLTVRTDALIPLVAPQEIEVDIIDDKAYVMWDPVEMATSYRYTYIYDLTEYSGTTTDTEFAIDLEEGYYQVYVYAVPSEEGYKESAAAYITFNYDIPDSDELWRVTGQYTSLDYEETYPADLVALKDGSYMIESWGGKDYDYCQGYNIEFTVDGAGNITFTRVAEGYEKYMPTYYYIEMYDGYTTVFYANGYSTFTGNQNGGKIELYRFYPAGYDTFVW